MIHTHTSRCLLVLAVLIILPLPSHAMPAITCHCFTDRIFDPARPTVADPYFLATTQNSFFAAVFNIDRTTIIMKKQTGTPADDLWIAYGIAARTGMTPEGLLQARQRMPSWHELIAGLHLTTRTAGIHVSRNLHAKAPDTRLAEAVVDDIFTSYHLLDDAELKELRQRGATNQELIIATMIGAKLRRPAGNIFQEVKTGSKSWGALLNAAKITPADIPGEIAHLLKISQH